MQFYIDKLFLLVVLLVSSSVALAEDNNIGAGDQYNYFTQDFLRICGEMALSGNPPSIGASETTIELTATTRFHIFNRDERVICSLHASYGSSVSGLTEQELLTISPEWLENPEIFGPAFDTWILENETENFLHPNTDCLGILPYGDSVTEVLYSRAVSIKDTGRVIVVEVTRLVQSILEPSRGFQVRLHAIAYNFPPACLM